MSSFAAHHVVSLTSSTFQDAGEELAVSSNTRQTIESEKLYALLLDLKSPLDGIALRNTLKALNDHETSFSASLSTTASPDAEERVLKQLLTSRILVGLYAEALDLCLKEASTADSEADWWGDVGRSWQSVAWYLLATLPERLNRSFDAVQQALRSHGIPLRPSAFTPQSLRWLFPQSLRPTALTTAFFPHTSRQSHLLFTTPLELARQECKLRQKQLVELRNERAEELGNLLSMRTMIEAAIKSQSSLDLVTLYLRRAVGEKELSHPPANVVTSLNSLATYLLPLHASTHDSLFSTLQRPSRITLMWPGLALLPPISFLLYRLVYGSRESIAELALNTHDTLKGFWLGYVVEPIKGILDTVRTGGDDSARIVSQEAVRADIESLERMSVALGKDRLPLNNSQLQSLADQIRQGDLTPVLRIYEEDIKSPIRSAITGTLVRSLLIQIQKAKVDLDHALSGIDKLLKSQELTFAFVGVAPSLAIVYAVVSYLRDAWAGGRGNKRLGGHRKREATWLAVRRIERLLVTSPGGASEAKADEKSALPALTTGLLLISVSHLRSYAERYLPSRSLMREGFLEDVADLENPELSRTEKQQVVERMWRSWGNVLGWYTIGRLKSA